MREARWNFNPCEFCGCIYLSGYGSRLIEAFNPEPCTFLPIDIQLPENSICISFAETSQLVVMSEEYVTYWRVGRNHTLVLVNQAKHRKINLLSNMTPVVEAGKVYITFAGKCWMISLDVADQVGIGN